MNKNYLGIVAVLLSVTLTCCQTEVKQANESPVSATWQQQFDEQLQLNGHRNWILVVDKAFPQQPGMHIINTNEN